MIHTESTCNSDTGLEKPVIVGEEDRPFTAGPPGAVDSISFDDSSMGNVPSLMKLNEQKHSHEVDNFKNIVGGILLALCILIIVAFAVLDAILEIDSALFSGAFEFAKTIATAVIGYLFAANAKEK